MAETTKAIIFTTESIEQAGTHLTDQIQTWQHNNPTANITKIQPLKNRYALGVIVTYINKE